MRLLRNRKKGNDRKAQAALEFMMTYGWMMLILTVVVASLVYFMPNIRGVTTGRCIFGPAMPCMGSTLTASNLTIVLKNNLGQAVYNVSVNLTVPINKMCTVSNPIIVADGKINITCQNNGSMNLSRDTRIRALVTYKKVKGGYDQSLSGEVYAKYQDRP